MKNRHLKKSKIIPLQLIFNGYLTICIAIQLSSTTNASFTYMFNIEGHISFSSQYSKPQTSEKDTAKDEENFAKSIDPEQVTNKKEKNDHDSRKNAKEKGMTDKTVNEESFDLPQPVDENTENSE
ncbi:hypothetical protein ACQKCU_25805 [Heyndrickxia sporothermodurans]